MVGMVDPEVKAFAFLEERQQQSDLHCPSVLLGPPLLKCSLPLSSATQLSGKAHEDFSLTDVITVLH